MKKYLRVLAMNKKNNEVEKDIHLHRIIGQVFIGFCSISSVVLCSRSNRAVILITSVHAHGFGSLCDGVAVV